MDTCCWKGQLKKNEKLVSFKLETWVGAEVGKFGLKLERTTEVQSEVGK